MIIILKKSTAKDIELSNQLISISDILAIFIRYIYIKNIIIHRINVLFFYEMLKNIYAEKNNTFIKCIIILYIYIYLINIAKISEHTCYLSGHLLFTQKLKKHEEKNK